MWPQRPVALGFFVVVLTSIAPAFAADHTPSLESGGHVPPAIAAPPPERRPESKKSPQAQQDDASREKTLALLLLMLKEGHGAR